MSTFLYEGRCYSNCPERSYIVPETTKGSKSRFKSLSLRHAGEEDSLAATQIITIPSDKKLLEEKNVPQKLCASCHYSCLKCRGRNDYDCIDCAPDSMYTVVSDTEAYCYPPVKVLDENAEVNFILKLNSNELLLLGGVLGTLVFVFVLGGYFFFRHICCSGKPYTYNQLGTTDDQPNRQIYNRNSAVAFKKEIESIINDPTSTSSEDDEY